MSRQKSIRLLLLVSCVPLPLRNFVTALRHFQAHRTLPATFSHSRLDTIQNFRFLHHVDLVAPSFSHGELVTGVRRTGEPPAVAAAASQLRRQLVCGKPFSLLKMRRGEVCMPSFRRAHNAIAGHGGLVRADTRVRLFRSRCQPCTAACGFCIGRRAV